jgi:hypothetical protein
MRFCGQDNEHLSFNKIFTAINTCINSNPVIALQCTVELERHVETTVRPPSGHCQTTIRPDHCQTTVRPLSDQTTVRSLSDHCQTTVRSLSDHCQTTVRSLSDHCQTTVKQLSDHQFSLPLPVHQQIHHMFIFRIYWLLRVFLVYP